LARENRPSPEHRSAFSPREPEFPARDEQAPEAGQAEAGRAPGFGRRPRTAPQAAPVAPEKARAILASLAATKLAAEAGQNPEPDPKTKAKPESEPKSTSRPPKPKPKKAKPESESKPEKAKPESKSEPDSRSKPGSEPGPKSKPGKTRPDGSARRRFRPFVLAVVTGAGLAVLAGVAIGVVKASDRHSATTTAGAADTPTKAVAPAVPSTDANVTPSQTPSADPAMKASPPAVAATVPEPPVVGAWPLSVNALASSGKADGVAAKVTFSAGTAVFTGANNSDITTPAAVLATGPGANFTVSAWVDLTSLPTSASKAATAVSQGAGINSAFYLQYFESANRWAFARMDTDTAKSKAARTLSLTTAQTNVWTHLVGVYTAAGGSVTLYVNGVNQGTTKDTTPFASTQGLEIGGARLDNAGSDGFTGAIKDVRVFNQALSPQQVAGLN
jgi:Concanavalin A-like lectin/glucanases superfamily